MFTLLVYLILGFAGYIIVKWVLEGVSYKPPAKQQKTIDVQYVYVNDNDPTPPYGIKIPD